MNEGGSCILVWCLLVVFSCGEDTQSMTADFRKIFVSLYLLLKQEGAPKFPRKLRAFPGDKPIVTREGGRGQARHGSFDARSRNPCTKETKCTAAFYGIYRFSKYMLHFWVTTSQFYTKIGQSKTRFRAKLGCCNLGYPNTFLQSYLRETLLHVTFCSRRHLEARKAWQLM